MDVVKSRLQKGEDGTNSARVLISRIWKEEGYRGVFRVCASHGTSTSSKFRFRLTGLLDEHRSLGVASLLQFPATLYLTANVFTGLKCLFIGCFMSLSSPGSFQGTPLPLRKHHLNPYLDSPRRV
jgi:hypothetical protein